MLQCVFFVVLLPATQHRRSLRSAYIKALLNGDLTDSDWYEKGDYLPSYSYNFLDTNHKNIVETTNFSLYYAAVSIQSAFITPNNPFLSIHMFLIRRITRFVVLPHSVTV